MSIISFSNKFIFLKTRKVAGTSVQMLLREFAQGPDDIIAAITPRDEFDAISSGLRSKNFFVNKADENAFYEAVAEREFAKAREILGSSKRYMSSHVDIKLLKKMVEKKGYDINEFYIFSIERHPYSWLVSNCRYNNTNYNDNASGLDVQISPDKLNKKIGAFLNRENVSNLLNWNMYTENNAVVVSKVIKYENLHDGMLEVARDIGFEIDPKNLGFYKSQKPVSADVILDDENKLLAQKVFKPVFDYFGYEK